MIGLFCFVLAVLASPIKAKLRLEAENAVLRHQSIVLRRSLQGRVRLTNNDRWFLVQMYRRFPAILKVVTIVQPETPVLIILSLVFWFWMWGVLGAILAVPVLAILKIISDRLRPLKALGHFLEGE
jgi:AI-2E family transporter